MKRGMGEPRRNASHHRRLERDEVVFFAWIVVTASLLAGVVLFFAVSTHCRALTTEAESQRARTRWWRLNPVDL